MKTQRLLWVLALFFLVLPPAFAKSSSASADANSFDKLKSLLGNWTTTTNVHGKTETVKLNYRTTAGGSALEETIFAGSPEEMISMYTVDQGKVIMTHYCMMGNQPRLQEVSADKNQIKMEQRDITGTKSAQEAHMGGLTVTFKDPDHFQQDWLHFNPDGTSQISTFTWTREK